MFRYVAFVWNRDSASAQRLASHLGEQLQLQTTDWRSVWKDAGMSVFCGGIREGISEPHMLKGSRGVVLGTLFRKRDVDASPLKYAAPILTNDESEEIVSGGGRPLVESFWGSYVAFLSNPGARRIQVVRDPTGDLPCFRTAFDGLIVLFSCLEDIVRLGVAKLDVDWSYLRARSANIYSTNQGTGFGSVTEIYRGQCWEFDGEGEFRHLYWNPTAIAQSGVIDDPASAARELRRTVSRCVSLRASPYRRLLARVSGGLDSSIVLGCLAKAPIDSDVTCYTIHVPGSRADERPWARMAVQKAGFRHIEQERDANVDLHQLLCFSPTPWPTVNLPPLIGNPFERSLSQGTVAAVLTGDGGDGLFGRQSRRYAASEYILRKGSHGNLLRIASTSALLTGTTIWDILGDAIRSKYRGSIYSREHQRIKRGRALLTDEIVVSNLRNERYEHPWFQDCRSTPWAMILQLGSLVGPSYSYDPLRDPDDIYPEEISPLYSQPVVELCLRIPLHLHLYDGRDRGLARHAFAEEVPAQILMRESKDRVPGYVEDILRLNLQFIREMLLDGQLVREGILDFARLEAALAGGPAKSEGSAIEILDYLFIESWVSSSTKQRYRIAA